MDNYYLKYADEIPYPHPTIKVIKEEYLLSWKKNILNELSILNNLFLEKYSLNIEENIKKVISTITSIIEQYRYSFLENYLYYLSNDDKFYININDEENCFKLKFLKDIYNSILLLIDNLFSSNKLLQIIYQDKFQNLIQNKKNSDINNILIQINNNDFYNKLNLDIEKLQKKLEQYKDIFNYNKNQGTIYPNDEELNKIFEEFNKKNRDKNIEIQKKIKKCNNKIIIDKLISKKADIFIPPTNPEFNEIFNISKNIQLIKDDVNEIKEKQNNYCISSLINKNKEFDEFNKIKINTGEIINEVEEIKEEIKKYNDKYLKIVNEIENQDKKFAEIKIRNDDINNKINQFINNINH